MAESLRELVHKHAEELSDTEGISLEHARGLIYAANPGLATAVRKERLHAAPGDRVNQGAGAGESVATGPAIDAVGVAIELGKLAEEVGVPALVRGIRRELQRTDLTPAERAGLQTALRALGEHVAPSDALEHGTPDDLAAKSATALRDFRDELVVKHLGRPPVSAGELARVRKIVHDGRPGLAAACREEERAEKLGDGATASD